MTVKLACHNLIASRHDRTELFVGHLFGAKLIIGDSRRLFEYAKSMDYLPWL
jgi:hypothetical protein